MARARVPILITKSVNWDGFGSRPGPILTSTASPGRLLLLDSGNIADSGVTQDNDLFTWFGVTRLWVIVWRAVG